MNKTGLLLITASLLILGAGCGKSTPKDSTDASTSSAVTAPNVSGIAIENFNYAPSPLIVAAGQSVTVKNLDSVAHSVTSDEEGLFDSKLIGSEKATNFTAPSEPGEYPYHCIAHPEMTGLLIVQ